MNAPTPHNDVDPLDAVPACLRRRPQWVCWRQVLRPGKPKPTKVPFDAKTGREASSTDESTWRAFDEAVAAFRASRGTARAYDGVGYVFAADDPYAGIDFDDCRDLATGDIKSWARALLLRLDSYAEVSPSGTGVKVIVEATKTGDRCRRAYGGGRVEVYDRGRFFTVTGDRLDDMSSDVMPRQEELAEVYAQVFGDAAADEDEDDDAADVPVKRAGVKTGPTEAGRRAVGNAAATALADDQIIAKALRSRSGAKVAALWSGEWGGGYNSQSEADSALVFVLAFYTKDPAQLDRLFRQSGLMRDKWDEHHGERTYGQMTIANALAKVTAQWAPRDAVARVDGQDGASGGTAEGGGRDGDGDGEDDGGSDRDGGDNDDDNGPGSAGTPGAAPLPPKIIVGDAQLSDLTRRALRALAAANAPEPVVFVRGGTLCRVTADERGRPLIQPYDKIRLRGRLADVAEFFKVETVRREARLVGVIPPLPVAEDVLARADWPAEDFPPLLGVARAPILRDDGTVCATPGYDRRSGLLYRPMPGLVVPPIPDRPTAAEVRVAAAALTDLVADFPFADPASRANALAILFSLVMRPVIRGHVPLAIANAPVQGTGKTLLLTVLGIVGAGDVAAESIPSKDNDDEWRKKITTILMAGGSYVLLDNVPDHASVDWPALASALTSELWSDRILGVSGGACVPSRAVWVASGNNLRVGADMLRRSYTIDLDANAERPWERRGFAIADLEQYARDNRGSLMAAAFTVVRGWYAAGRPRAASLPTVGSFQEWVDTIGSVLAFAGVDGFLGNLQRARATQDEDGRQWTALFEAWAQRLGDAAVTADRVLTTVTSGEDGEPPCALPDPLLAHQDKGERAAGAMRRSLGRQLAKMCGRVFAGRKLCAAGEDTHTKVKLWRLAPLNGGNGAGGAQPANPAVPNHQPATQPAGGGEW